MTTAVKTMCSNRIWEAGGGVKNIIRVTELLIALRRFSERWELYKVVSPHYLAELHEFSVNFNIFLGHIIYIEALHVMSCHGSAMVMPSKMEDKMH